MKLPMVRVHVVGLKAHALPTIHALQRLGCVQIDDTTAEPLANVTRLALTPQTLQRQEELHHLAIQSESILATFGAPNSGARNNGATLTVPAGCDCLAEARADLQAIAARVQDLAQQRERLQAEQASLPRYEATLRRLMPIVPPEAHDEDNASVVVLVSRAHQWVLDTLEEQVKRLAGDTAVLLQENVAPETRAMLIVLPRTLAPELEQILGREDISRLRLPDTFAEQPPDVAAATLNKRMTEIPRELAAVGAQLNDLAQTWRPRLTLWRACLRDQLDQIDILPQLGETEHTFVLTGWTPAADVARVGDALATAVGPEVLLTSHAVTADEEKDAPVALHNPAPARPFQSLVGLLAWPRYDGIDPTLLMALFMPLFFGMILGDVGYGTLLLLLSLLGLWRFPQPGARRDIIKILALGAVWSIIFGFLYGEMFGTLGEALGMHPLWLGRAEPEHVGALLLFTLAVGAVHVTLGLVLGVWEAWRHRSRSHLLERGGMLVGIVGLFLLVSVLLQWLPSGVMTPAVALLVVGIALLGASVGWLGILLGPIEFISLLGNILSYLRIAAVGLASVYVALVANELAGSLGSVIVGVIVALLIHALNLALGAFSPTIHSLRLHYVEFFRKFYEGGGRPFAPFRSRLKTETGD